MQRQGASRLSWRNRDHTQGSLLASMLVLALPSIGMGIAGAATYQLVDLKFISLLGAAPLAAVVVSESEASTVALDDTVESLGRFLPEKRMIVLPRLREATEPWRAAPDLTDALD